MPVTYKGKDGPDVLLLELVTWDGDRQRHITEQARAPRRQVADGPHGPYNLSGHPGHIHAVRDGDRPICISPSVAGFSDVRKRFKWS